MAIAGSANINYETAVKLTSYRSTILRIEIGVNLGDRQYVRSVSPARVSYLIEQVEGCGVAFLDGEDLQRC